MKRLSPVIVIISLLTADVTLSATTDDLFEKPVPLADKSGKVLMTGKSHGCPYIADHNRDGKFDIILAAKESMNSPIGKIWIITNEGTASQPRFSWSSAVRVRTMMDYFKINSN